MSDEAMKHFLLVSNLQQDGWHSILGEALAAIGRLESVKEEPSVERAMERNFALIIVDATSIKKVELLIERILAQRHRVRIVVVTASPTWQLARAAFKAGAVEYILKSSNKEELLMFFKDILSKPLPPPR